VLFQAIGMGANGRLGPISAVVVLARDEHLCDLHVVLNSDVALLVLWRAEMQRVSEVL
jgi:hypothetical protein